MLTPTKLFCIRLLQHYRYMGKSLKTIADWTVWLYILIPGLFIFSGLYIELWTRLPEWSHNVRWELIMIAVLGLMMNTQVHIGVDEADRLILLQHQGWLIKLKRYGYVYSVVMLLLRMSLVFTLLLPFILGTTELTSDQLQLLLAYSAVVGLLQLAINHYFAKAGSWWRRTLRIGLRALLLAVIYVFPVALYLLEQWSFKYMFGALVVLILLTFGLIYRYMTTVFHYGQQLEQEQAKRARFTGMLLSQVEENKSTKRLKKPWFYRSSQRIFKSDNISVVVAELRFKAMLRSKALLQAWIMLTAVGSLAIILVGGISSWVVVAGLLLLKRSVLKMQWNQWIQSDYISLYVKEQYAAYKLSQHVLTVPGLFIWIVIAIICSI